MSTVYKVTRTSLGGQAPARMALLQSIDFVDHGSRCVAEIAGEALFELSTLDAVLGAMKLTRDDVEARRR